jgi:hypothetical protein
VFESSSICKSLPLQVLVLYKNPSCSLDASDATEEIDMMSSFETSSSSSSISSLVCSSSSSEVSLEFFF